MPRQFEHVVKEWELRWRRLFFGSRISSEKRFTLKIGYDEIMQVKADNQGRIWVGEPIRQLTAGTKYLIVINDSEDEVTINFP
jgi:DNA-binding transcriptional regulator/RsmH inhibitor MraZ